LKKKTEISLYLVKCTNNDIFESLNIILKIYYRNSNITLAE